MTEHKPETFPAEENWQARAEAAEAALTDLQAQLERRPQIICGGGIPAEEEAYFTAEEIRSMSSGEINSKWQEIKRSLKRFC